MYRKQALEGKEGVQGVVLATKDRKQRRFVISIVSALHSYAGYPLALLPFVAIE